MSLVLSEVYKKYGKTVANDKVSVQFKAGELTAILGHNGAGKTTLLNQMCGIAKPTSGTIELDGISLVRRPDYARRACSVMAQLNTPLQGVTPSQALQAVGRIRGMSSSQAQEASAVMVDRLAITEWADKKSEHLSGGLQRMTSYGMAAMVPASIYLIDEPTNDVDPERRPIIWSDLRRLADGGSMVIVVSHNLLEVQRAVDRIILMKEGKVVIDGSPSTLAAAAGLTLMSLQNVREDVLTSMPEHSHLEEASHNGAIVSLSREQVPAAVHWAAAAMENGSIDNFSLQPTSLESLYRSLA